jgi:hypothetical protein
MILFQGVDSYGTFSGNIEEPPLTTTTVSSYPYALSSQTPTVIVIGGCPACKVCVLSDILRRIFCFMFRLACWKVILHF